MIHTDLRKIMFKEDSLKLVDLISDELYISLRTDPDNYYYIYKDQVYYGYAEHYNYLLDIKDKDLTPRFKKIKTKTIDGIRYRVLSYDIKNHFTQDYLTGEVIPNFSEITLYIDNQTKLVQRIERKKIKNNKFDTINDDLTYYFSDYDYSSHDYLIDSLFDFNSEEYSYFKRLFGDKRYIQEEEADDKDTIMNDIILNHPIISLGGDTTTIKDLNGWLLLDFWFIGCGPCMNLFDILSKEKQEQGGLALEKEGIKVLLINPLSSNNKLIEKTIEKFDLRDYFYHSRGINKHLSISRMPHLFLISPDKKIVYTSHGLVDYSKILNIVNSYKK